MVQVQPIILVSQATGFVWSEALRARPGATLDALVERVDSRAGRFAVVVLQRVRGLDAAAIEAVRVRLLARYQDAEFELLKPAGPDGALVRTRLDVEAFAGPALRFAMRFHEQVKDVLVHLEADRMCLRATPLKPDLAEETARPAAGLRGAAGAAARHDRPRGRRLLVRGPRTAALSVGPALS